MHRRHLYTAFSLSEYITTLVLRFICLVAVMFSVPHYDENPVAVSIAVLLFSAGILFLGNDQITVYEDRVSQNSHSIFSLLSRKRATVIYITDISRVYLEGKISIKEIGIAATLTLILPRTRIRRSRRANNFPLEFNLKSGETIKMYSDLSYDQLKKVESVVNSLIR